MQFRNQKKISLMKPGQRVIVNDYEHPAYGNVGKIESISLSRNAYVVVFNNEVEYIEFQKVVPYFNEKDEKKILKGNLEQMLDLALLTHDKVWFEEIKAKLSQLS